MHITNLPAEVLLVVISYLDFYTICRSFAQTCKAFNFATKCLSMAQANAIMDVSYPNGYDYRLVCALIKKIEKEALNSPLFMAMFKFFSHEQKCTVLGAHADAMFMDYVVKKNLISLDSILKNSLTIYDRATRYGNKSILEWIENTFPERVNYSASDLLHTLNKITYNGHFETAKWWVQRHKMTKKMSQNAYRYDFLVNAVTKKDMESFVWLYDYFELTEADLSLRDKRELYMKAIQTSNFAIAELVIQKTNYCVGISNFLLYESAFMLDRAIETDNVAIVELHHMYTPVTMNVLSSYDWGVMTKIFNFKAVKILKWVLSTLSFSGKNKKDLLVTLTNQMQPICREIKDMPEWTRFRLN